MENQVFQEYSKYYDLLYKDKDYKAESDYIDSLIKRHSYTTPHSIMNLGCGTGKHDMYMSKRNYEMTGVDMSSQMLEIARNSGIPNSDFIEGDIRTFRIDKKFDAILSLFHVMSYQSTEKDLYNALTTVKHHLKKGGLFIFDFWYGPAVLNEKPAKRIKEVENEDLKVIRHTNPVMYPEQNIVDVQFDVQIIDKKAKKEFRTKESHKMRYFFLEELREMLKSLEFSILAEEEWMTGKPLSNTTWNACLITKA